MSQEFPTQYELSIYLTKLPGPRLQSILDRFTFQNVAGERTSPIYWVAFNTTPVIAGLSLKQVEAVLADEDPDAVVSLKRTEVLYTYQSSRPQRRQFKYLPEPT